MAQLQHGNFDSAYKYFRDRAVFPYLVCGICAAPCLEECCRTGTDEPVNIPLLMKALCEYARETEHPRYNLPLRHERVAVIGAGLSGLACALRLGRKKYDVTVYEAGSVPGGRANGLLAPSEVAAEIERQMTGARIAIEYGCDVESLEDLDFDAAYIATGSGGGGFGLLDGFNKDTLAAVQPGIFLGGALVGAAPTFDVAQGVFVAYSIEKFFKTGLTDGMPEAYPVTASEIVMDMSGVREAVPALPVSGDGYTREEAILEAGRCIKCDCVLCREACELFEYFDKEPKQIIGDAIASQHAGDFAVTRQTTTQIIASCNLCGLCGKICPKDIDIGMMAYDFRYYKRLSGKYPPTYADYYLKDMAFANTEAAFTRGPEDGDTGAGGSEWMFFPGCQLGADNPAYVTEAYRYLIGKKSDTAIMLYCCGAPADWGGAAEENTAALEYIHAVWEERGRPVMVCACPTCMKQFERFFPDMELISLYEILSEDDRAYEKEGAGMVSVFDPCSSRDFPKAQKSVRALAEAHGYAVDELPYSGERAQCCGTGAQTRAANPKLSDIMANNRCGEKDLLYICYCASCRDTFRTRGKDCVHILDIVFDPDPGDRPMPTLDERRKNRIETKVRIAEEFFGQEPGADPGSKAQGFDEPELIIPPELIKKMKQLLAREREIKDAVLYCERTNNKIHDTERDIFIGHHRQGLVTFWVEYKKNGAGFELLNVYAHRIGIVGEEGRDD